MFKEVKLHVAHNKDIINLCDYCVYHVVNCAAKHVLFSNTKPTDDNIVGCDTFRSDSAPDGLVGEPAVLHIKE